MQTCYKLAHSKPKVIGSFPTLRMHLLIESKLMAVPVFMQEKSMLVMVLCHHVKLASS